VDSSQIKKLVEYGMHDRALHYLHEYEKLYPNDAEVSYLLADTYNRISNHAISEKYFNRTIELDPKYTIAYTNLEQLIREQGRYSECREILEKVRKLQPSLNGVIESSLSLLDLTDGLLETGFPRYENRFFFKHMKDAYGKHLFPRWDGKASLKNKRVLMRYEQGLGDTLQFSRYAKAIKTMGAKKIDILCKPALFRILESIPGVSKAISDVGTNTYDYEVMMMSMPYLVHTAKESDIPGKPYFSVKPSDAKTWLAKMNPTGKLKVGLVWSGELKKGLKCWEAERMNVHRSIPLKEWAPILEADCDYYSLQKGEMEASLLDFHPAHPIKNIMGEVKDFYDTACIVENLDLVISVDTSMAHLVGGMGKPIWMFSRLDGDWRWGYKKTKTPWYPSMEIVPQMKFADWKLEITEVASNLKALTANTLEIRSNL
jgi:hypothetical protein